MRSSQRDKSRVLQKPIEKYFHGHNKKEMAGKNEKLTGKILACCENWLVLAN